MSIDLTSKVGLPVYLKDDNMLELGDGVETDGMSIRSFADLAVVAADSSLNLPDKPAYYMYRNVHKQGDEELLAKHNQRFDLTVIPAGLIGEEYIKTSGHYHPIKQGTDVEYPELYYVVSGQATYLMQKHDQNGVISDVILARVKAGEAILMPPSYGHVTINETVETLVMANWVEANFSSVYGDYEQKRGAAYYIKSEIRNPKSETSMGDQNKGAVYEKNANYNNLPELWEAESQPKALDSLKGIPIYKYAEQIEKIELVAKPENYLADYEIKKLFVMK